MSEAILEQPVLFEYSLELCEKCGARPRFWSSRWCDPCMWELVKPDANPEPLEMPF